MSTLSAGTATSMQAPADGSERLASERPIERPDGGDELPRPHGRYLLLRRIARGGMGEVFLASTLGVEGAERPAIVKIIRREHVNDPSFVARFLDETRVQAQLQHSGVAQVLEAAVDETSGEPYAVIEHVEGRSLGDMRARAVQLGARIAWVEAVAIATLIAEALAHVHEREDASGKPLAIVHRDLSPQNVMLSYAGDAKLIDFGTARGQNRRCHTVAGVVFAKPGYVAPEVANGDSGDFRVDLYALGIMLWELCVGHRFLQGEASEHLAAVARDAKNPPPIADRVGAPAALDTVIAKLTAFDREARYEASRLAARDLAQLLASALPLANGERGVRARLAALMQRLFPTEPGRTRREFARLIASARVKGILPARSPTPSAVATEKPSTPVPSSSEASDTRRLTGTRYRLGREIGRGASSVVYEAEHVDLGRRVALKLIEGEGARSDAFVERFRADARTLAGLRHPSLVELVDIGIAADGRPFCAMELLEGTTLDQRIARGPLDAHEALGIAFAVLKGLDVAHAAGLVHRDIKPANVFLTNRGSVKLLDFGLAQQTELPRDGEGAAEPADGASRDGRPLALYGTPEYMAPEQGLGGRVDARADVYALGCVLYEMLTGRLPFVGPSAIAVLAAKTKGSPERLGERAPALRIPAHVDDLVMRAIARHPSVRFQSAGEMADAVERALEQPLQTRSTRRALGFSALAGSMAFAAVLLVGAARLRHAVPGWLAHAIGSRQPTADAMTPLPPAPRPAGGDAHLAVSVAAPHAAETAFVDPGAPAPEPERAHAAIARASEPAVAHPHPRRRTGDASRSAPSEKSAAAAPSTSSMPSSAPPAASVASAPAPVPTEHGDATLPPAATAEPIAAPGDATAPSESPAAGHAVIASPPAASAAAPGAAPDGTLQAKRAGAAPPKQPPKAGGATPTHHKKRTRLAHKPE